MTSRNHDIMMEGLLAGIQDFYREDADPRTESLRIAIEAILNATREEACAANNSSTVWRLWPEDDEFGMRYKVSKILTLLSSRTATGALTDFLESTHTLNATDHIKVVERCDGFGRSRFERDTYVSKIYKSDELPERYRKYPVPSHPGDLQLLRLYSVGVGD